MSGAAALSAEPARTVVFEDAVSGVEAGKNGGFIVVGIGDENILNKADFVLADLEGLSIQKLTDRLS